MTGRTTGRTIVSGVEGRYATALFDLAKEQGRLDRIEADLATLKALLAESADFRALIANPLFSREAQGKAVAALLAAIESDGLTKNFLGVLAGNGRLAILPRVVDAFSRLLADERGEVMAQVTSARALTKAQMKAVSDMLASYAGREVKIEPQVDESLLGGLVVRLGSRMIDTSLKSKLNHLQLAMKEVG